MKLLFPDCRYIPHFSLKFFFSLLIMSAVFSCIKTEQITPNRPPGDFMIAEPKVERDGKTVILHWTPAKDPDGDFVKYTIILKDTLAKNLSQMTFPISGLDYNFSGEGQILATDSKGLQARSVFKIQTKTVTFIEIPDKNFEQSLVDQKIDKDGKVDGRIDEMDVKKIEFLDVSNNEIKSLKGIEYFTELEALICVHNLITELDLSKNTRLYSLNCSKNKLSQLDLIKNTNLNYLDCSSNKLTNLKLGKNEKLKEVICWSNLLKEVSAPDCANLLALDCSSNRCEIIDVSKNTQLLALVAVSNKLRTIDLSKNINLTYLQVTSNFIPALDVSQNTALKALYCNNNYLTTLNISKNEKLEYFGAVGNKIPVICVNDITKVNASSWSKDPDTVFSKCQ